MVAEGIRRDQDLSEMSHTDADSDAGLPDDSDDAEDVMEVQCVCVCVCVGGSVCVCVCVCIGDGV
jgi:hypothetical protein